MTTQLEIAEHLDMSQPTVSVLMDDLGINWKVVSLDEIRIAYIRRLREQASWRAASGDLDLASERARLAREQADKISMQNSVTRLELSSTFVLEKLLARVASRIDSIFSAVPSEISRRVPCLAASEIEMIDGEITKVRNIVASMTLSRIDDDGEMLTESDDGLEGSADGAL